MRKNDSEIGADVPTVLTEDGQLYVLTGEFDKRPEAFTHWGRSLRLQFDSGSRRCFNVGPRTVAILGLIDAIHVSETGRDGPVHITEVRRENPRGGLELQRIAPPRLFRLLLTPPPVRFSYRDGFYLVVKH